MDTPFDPDQPQEPLRILSDLHLGHPASRIRDTKQLLPLIEGARTVIFNGDSSEERKPSYRETGDTLRASLAECCRACGAQPVFLSGNHDPITPTIHHLDLYGGMVFVTHGDVFYPNVAPWNRHHRLASAIMRRIRAEYSPDQLQKLEFLLEINRRISRELTPSQPHGKPGLLALAQTLWHEAWPPDRPFRILHTWATAPAVAHTFIAQFRPNARLTLVGHTHRRFLNQQNDRTIVNTGAFLTFARAYMVEIANRTAKILPIIHKNGRFTTAPTPIATQAV